jgi:hypothetical protein
MAFSQRAKRRGAVGDAPQQQPKTECRKCRMGPSYHKAHNKDCSQSVAYQRQKTQRAAENAAPFFRGPEAVSNAAKPPPSAAKPPPPPPDAKPTEKATRAPNFVQATVYGSKILPEDDTLSYSTVKKKILKNLPMVKAAYATRASRRRPPPELAAFVYYVLTERFPNRYETKSNVRSKGDESNKKWDWHQRHFRGGKFCFTIPMSEEPEKPDAHYAVVEGVRIWFLRWELVFPGFCLECSKCKKGKLIHTKFPFLNGRFPAIPVLFLDTEKPIDWAIPMQYECDNPSCKEKFLGSDGCLLHQLPLRTQLESSSLSLKTTGSSKITVQLEMFDH